MIDIKEITQRVIAQTETALLALVTDAGPKAMEAVKTYSSNAVGRVTVLMEYMTGEDDDETPNDKLKFLLARLKDEKAILESEFLSFVVMGKQLAQDAVNTVTTILVMAVAEILPELD